MTAALIGFAILIALSFTGISLAFATLLVGFIGFWSIRGLESSIAMSGQQIAEMIVNPNLVVVPIFVLMGEFIRRGRIADELYEFGNALWVGCAGGWPCRPCSPVAPSPRFAAAQWPRPPP